MFFFIGSVLATCVVMSQFICIAPLLVPHQTTCNPHTNSPACVVATTHLLRAENNYWVMSNNSLHSALSLPAHMNHEFINVTFTI